MSGNIYEFCEDWYHFGYNGAPTDGSAWLSPPGNDRVCRGGFARDPAHLCRSAHRGALTTYNRYSYDGLRVAWTDN